MGRRMNTAFIDLIEVLEKYNIPFTVELSESEPEQTINFDDPDSCGHAWFIFDTEGNFKDLGIPN